ncbi:MAG: preprotein translocase subunit SecY [Candidatus Margulisiibacteriota bacterium]|nr:MAG: preprotein translocase subunit SecY [Candidatus Margulisbacteria bacterium GWD2_39_127]OGI04625.1 MAG: preprotein translocase subunit SecY [Candidatus Margulisbacteria bacterium GWF2_38_17]OGI11843.1 MAG: preprotein translocase subunit SecY [Candidatus Margulisbacteria bacterium GWE2_39_32]PZM79783.1 MAG: preprotein translocase subunit SecY [Candidatus Margulisiibacteriota bacterium]HAR62689.1 preprotein translocase subunit SecY [Candidatus Margulisiibacteriota bacterium]
MISNIKNLFRIKELRNRVFFSLLIVIVYRIGSHIPIAGVDQTALDNLFGQGGFFGFVDLFSGGSLRRFSIFALGIIPYINASIIMQLLTVVTPQLKEMMEEGELGRKKVQQYTRYLAIVLAFLQALAMSAGFRSILSPDTSFSVFMFTSVFSLVAGTSLVMWLGELITERGIGNGASIIIFVGIISMIPSYILSTYSLVLGGASIVSVVFLLLIFCAVIVGIIIVQEGQRKIPVQYTKRIVGRKEHGGQNTYIPLRINQGGVIPIIFASSVLAFPATLAQFISPLRFLSDWFNPGGALYMLFFAGLIFFFTYFYTAITFNPVELADNIKKYGGFIVGVRPGRATADYLEKIISRLTLVGAVFLSIIAITPMLAANITNVTSFIGLGGTALLIMVGVAIDLMKQIETHFVTRQYDGMLE